MNNENNPSNADSNQGQDEPQIRLKTVSEIEDSIMKKMTETYAKTITTQVMQNIQRHFLIDDKYKPEKKEEPVEKKPLTDQEAIQLEVDKALKEFRMKKL